MAKVKIKNLRQVQANIRKLITKAARDPELRAEIGEVVVEEIKNTDLGRPAKSTIEWRRRYETTNTVDDKYRRNKIKALFTGELLKDLIRNVKLKTTKGLIEYKIEHTDKSHKKYKGIKKARIGSGAKYKTIQQGLLALGYDYLDLKDSSVRKVVALIRKRLKRNIKRLSS